MREAFDILPEDNRVAGFGHLFVEGEELEIFMLIAVSHCYIATSRMVDCGITYMIFTTS